MKTICPVFFQMEDASFISEWNTLQACSCDMIEVRLDRWLAMQSETSPQAHSQACAQMKSLAKQSEKPVIWTLRTKEEGGECAIGLEAYGEWIRFLFSLPGYTDVQLARARQMDKEQIQAEKCILSFHDFEKTPSMPELEEIWKGMDAFAPAYEKIALMPNSRQDMLDLLLSCATHKAPHEKIAISMGELGRMSRILTDLFDSSCTFASHTTSSAPGQVSLDELDFYKSVFDKINLNLHENYDGIK